MANEFVVRKGIIVSGSSQQSLRTVGNGNILIGSGATDLGSTLSVIGSSIMSGNTSGSTMLNVVGSQGQLFSVVDTLTGSLMSVNDITGLPILEVFSDDRVVMGEYGANALIVSGRSTGFGVTPTDSNYRIISSGSTLFSGGTMVIKGSGTTSSSTAFAIQNSTGGTLLNLFNNGNLNIDSGLLFVDATNNRIGVGTSSPSTTLHVSQAAGIFRLTNTNNNYYVDFGFPALAGGEPSLSMYTSGISNGRIFQRQPTTNDVYVGDIDANNGSVIIRSNGNDVVKVTNTGNVLIGTTTDAGQKLQVNGSARFVGGGATSGTTGVTIVNSSNYTSVQVLDNGYVGLGVTAPLAPLHVYYPGTSPSTKLIAIFDGYQSPAQPVMQIQVGRESGNLGTYLGYDMPNSVGFIKRIGASSNSLTWNDLSNVAIGGNATQNNALTIYGRSYGSSTSFDTTGIMFRTASGTLTVISNSTAIPDISVVGLGTQTISSNVIGRDYGNVSNLYIDGPPRAGSSTTFVNAWSMYVNSGNTYFGGNVMLGLTGNTGQRLQVSGTSLFTGTLTNLSGGSSGQLFTMDLSQSAVTGNTIYAVNISPTLRNTASGQTQVALRVMPTFTGSSTGTSTTNKIVDFGSQNVGTQFTVTDATTGDIYMVNDVSGLPIIAANSSWDVSMYNYPNTVFKKTNNSLLLGVQNNTGSTVSVYGDLVINEGYGFTNTTTQVSGTTSTGATSAVTIYTLTTSSNKSYSVSCLTTGYGTSTRNTTSGKVEGAFRNSGGTLSMVGTTIQYISADIVSTNVDFELSGSSIVLRVTGTTTENYTWGSTITSQVI
jgi:hypothetical protein